MRRQRKIVKKKKQVNRKEIIKLIGIYLSITLLVTISGYFLSFINLKELITEKNYFFNITFPQKSSISNKIVESKQKNASEKKLETLKEIINTSSKKGLEKELLVDLNKRYPLIFDGVEKEEILKKERINTLPKLAIIIDDVTNKYEVSNIKAIGFDITISFMPPIKTHKNSAKIAQNLAFYMVHFPLEASTYRFEETNTLHVNDSYETIEKRVKQVRAWYPKARYTNNHTGSKFTSNEVSMDYFMRALKKYGFIFLDSKTTPKSVGEKYAKKYSVPYLSRDIFLDNKKEYNYILKQLKKAIKIAQKRGYAVAIGHPHKITLEVLTKSKKLFKDLNIVYVNKIPIE